MPPLLEIACFNTSSALTASSSGASRIELCTNASVGGTTPLLSTFQFLRTKNNSIPIPIPIYMMIRPHADTFVYTPASFQTMHSSIQTFKQHGADGFVFGILTGENKVDAERCMQLVQEAEGRPCTFHRAFDEIAEEEMEGELEVLIECGFRAVLTSGGKGGAVVGKGKGVLGRLVRRARGRIDVIVGGGVRSANIVGLWRETGAMSWHSSAIVGDGDVASAEEVRMLREFVDGI